MTTDFAIVPAGQESAMQVSKEARDVALAAASSIETTAGGPYMYLVQADSTAVDRGEGTGGDWLVAGLGDDKVVNLGKNPMVIVVGHQIRYVQTRKDETGQKRVVFNLPWEEMNADQQRATEIDWKQPDAAKPVDSFMLLHVTDKGIDPHGIKAFNYQPKPGSAKDGGKWAAGLKAVAKRPVPIAPFAAIWRLGSIKAEYEVEGRKVKKLAMTHEYHGAIDSRTPAWKGLHESWKSSGQAFASMNASESDQYEKMADQEAERIVDVAPVEDGPADYTASRDSGYGDEYATSLPEPDVPNAAKAMNMDWDTAIRCGKNEQGMWLKKPCCEMGSLEAKVAWDMAAPHTATSKEAAAVHELLTVWANHKGWQIGQPEF